MTKRTLIKNATIVNEGKKFIGSVVIENEIIAEILTKDEEPLTPCDIIINGAKQYLIPGIIDDHVHFRDPGLTHKADLYTESCAAAAGGVTSFMDMPNTQPQTTTLEALEQKFELGAEKSVVNYAFYFGATNNNIEQISKLNAKRVCGIKLFMGASTGNMLVSKMNNLIQLFNESELLIAAHCEDQQIISENTKRYLDKLGNDPAIFHHPFIRSTEACWASSSLAVKLAKSTGARLHILHISTARELALFNNFPIESKQITAEACTSHLLFNSSDYKKYGSHIKCNPAIKNTTNQKALINAINCDLIDVIGTDHAPHLLTEKEGGAFGAASGIPTIQFSLPALMQLVKKGEIKIEKLVEKMCHNPAKLFQIQNRGFIRVGYQADLVLVNLNHSWQVTPQIIKSKCAWSPFMYQTFDARVERTFVNGHQVYYNEVIDETKRGQALTFNRDSR